MNGRSSILLIYLIITGCTMDCLEPGLQSRNTSVSVDVPIHKDHLEDKIHWVDSGQIINQGEKIKFTLSGSANFCPLKEGKNPKRVLVPAGFCANGLIPNYSDKLIVNSGLDEREVCGSIGFGNNEFHTNRRYVDTGIKVNPGDKLSFNLVPREIIIDYHNPERNGISFDENCYINKIGDKKASIKEMLNGGTFYCGNNNKRTPIKFPQLNNKTIQKRKVLIGNGYTPYDNKVHFNKNYIKDENPWINGALLDLRRAKIGLNELCSNWKKCDFNKLNKYHSYELNCYCQNICYNQEGIWNFEIGVKGKQNCVSSIRYKKYDKENTCDMYSYLRRIERDIKAINFTKDDESWAEALVAKIGDLNNQDDAKAIQCLPERKGAKGNSLCSQIGNHFKHFSLKLNHDYKIDEKDMISGSSVMLAIASDGNYQAHRGGYHVEVTRSCNFENGKKLYMYLGNNPPLDPFTIKTNNFFKEVDKLDRIIDTDILYYIIDGTNLERKESKIYFGIDISNVERDDITDKNGKYYEDNNHYIVNLFLKRKINDFISSTVNKIFNFITDENKKDKIKIPYEGYRTGFLQGIRALLVLYVIFTVIGYMFGTVQLNKSDFIIRIFKIAFIAFAFSDKSWKFFGTILSELFVNGSIYLIDSLSGYMDTENKKFIFLDLTAGVLFTRETWLKFLSLVLCGPFGLIAFLMILKATFTFLKCIISATFKYVISTVLVTFLLSLAPLFIVFILFQQTRGLFDNWIKVLAHISLQPVILFAFLSLLNQLMYSVLYNLTNFSACYQCLISVNFLSYDLCIMKLILPLGYNPGINVDVALNTGEKSGVYFAALPVDLIQVLIYLIIASTMEAFVSISETMAQTIFSSGYGVTQSISHVAGSASQTILSTINLDDKAYNMIKNIKSGISKDRTTIEIRELEKKREI